MPRIRLELPGFCEGVYGVLVGGVGYNRRLHIVSNIGETSEKNIEHEIEISMIQKFSGS